jgi:arsenic resistance protein ArsH
MTADLPNLVHELGGPLKVSGGSQSFNVVNALRVLGRWMRMVTIPNQSSVPKAWQEFDAAGRMKPSPFYDRVMESWKN